MQYNKYNTMQHKATKYTVRYNEIQCNNIYNTILKIAYDTFKTKTEQFWPQKEPFWAFGARKRPAEQPNGHLPENRRYPKLPQDMGNL